MTKTIITLLLIFSLTRTLACSCAPPSISASYKASVVIFVGQYIGQTQIGNQNGIPSEIENFEVLRFLKGKDIKLIQEVLKNHYNGIKPVVSLSSSTHSSCGYKFSKDKYYLVYAYRDYNDGLITTNSCISTHEIEQGRLNEYLSATTTNTEVISLLNLAKADTSDKYTTLPDSIESYVPKILLIDSQTNLKKEITKRNVTLWVSISSIIILLLLLIRKTKKKR